MGEKQHECLEKDGYVHKITVSELRVKISRWVSDAWKEVSRDREFMAGMFKKTGLSFELMGRKMVKWVSLMLRVLGFLSKVGFLFKK